MTFVYMPPNGSPFYQDKCLNGISLFESAFVSLYNDSHYYLLMGDFNSRTGTLSDFEMFENKIDILEEYENAFDTFDLPRYSCDTYVSAFGRDLLDFCKVYFIYIMNGRVGQDKNIGDFTFIGINGASVNGAFAVRTTSWPYSHKMNTETPSAFTIAGRILTSKVPFLRV